MSTFLTVVLTVVSIISALLLIGIILIQQNKARGGLGAVSGGMAESMFGAGASNVLTKGTTWLAVVFLISTLLLAAVTGRMSTKSAVEGKDSAIGRLAEQKAQEAQKAEEAKAAEEAKKAEELKKAAETKAEETKAAAEKKVDDAKAAVEKKVDDAKAAAEVPAAK